MGQLLLKKDLGNSWKGEIWDPADFTIAMPKIKPLRTNIEIGDQQKEIGMARIREHLFETENEYPSQPASGVGRIDPDALQIGTRTKHPIELAPGKTADRRAEETLAAAFVVERRNGVQARSSRAGAGRDRAARGSRLLLRERVEHRVADRPVAGAATEVAVQLIADLGAGRSSRSVR